MARRQKLSVDVYLPLEGEQVLWCTVWEDGNVEWFLPKEKEEAIQAVKQKMLDNIGFNMSRYYSEHPELLK